MQYDFEMTIQCNDYQLHRKLKESYDKIVKSSPLQCVITKDVAPEDEPYEISCRLFVIAAILYFIYRLFDQKYHCYEEYTIKLQQIISEFINNRTWKKKCLKSGSYTFKKMVRAFRNNFDDGLKKLLSNGIYRLHPYVIKDIKEIQVLPALMNYCIYSKKLNDLYSKANQAILLNKDTTLWLDTLKLSAFTHTSNHDSATRTYIPKLKKSYHKINYDERVTIKLIEEILGNKGSFTLQPSDNFDRPFEKKDLFKLGINLDYGILKRFPCIPYLLYKLIPKMSYNKFKQYFIEDANPPEPYNNDGRKIYNNEEISKISFFKFKGKWGLERAQLFFFFAIRDMAKDKTSFDEALKKGFWNQPDIQKQLLNGLLRQNSIPEYSKEFNFNLISNIIKGTNKESFSTTETCINLIYNIAHFKVSNSPSDVTQQVNFIDEQRDRIFTYHKIKTSDQELKDITANAPNPKYFNQFCPQARDNLVKEIETIKSIDCGFDITHYAQKYPCYNNEFFVRHLKCKLFLETDTACNLPKEEFYKKRYNDLLSNRYIYPERNIFIHYSKCTQTESLLEEQYFSDLLICLQETKKRLQHEQELRKLAQIIDNRRIKISNSSSYVCFDCSYDKFISKLKNIISSDGYTGKLCDSDLDKINDFDSSKQFLKVLKDIKKNIPHSSTHLEYLNKCIQEFEEQHPNLYCLLKDILNRKEYSGKLTFSTFEEIKNKLHPSFRRDNIYFTLCDIKNGYKKKDKLSEELDRHIDFYKEGTLIIPQEDTKQLESFFNEAEQFISDNWEHLIDKFHDISSQKDSDKLRTILHFIRSYDNPEKIQTYIPPDNPFPSDKINSYQESLNKIKNLISTKYLTEKLRNALNKKSNESILGTISNLQFTLGTFYAITEISFNRNSIDLYTQELLYEIKYIFDEINKAKNILEDFGQTDNQLTIFNITELQQLLDQREFDNFSAQIEKIVKHINNSILFRHKTTPNCMAPLLDRNEIIDSRKKYLQTIETNIKKYIKNKDIDKLLNVLGHVEYFEIRNIELNKKTQNFEKKFLDFAENINELCKSIPNEKIKNLAEEISNSISKKKEKASLEYDEKSVDLFEDDDTYDSYLIKACKKHLIEAIKYCTSSTQIREKLKDKAIINEKGRLGITPDKNLSQTFKYPEEFKKELRVFLNSLFGVEHICTLRKKPEGSINLDSLSENDIEETDVSFFDLYGNQIMLYLIKVTLEFAQVQKMQI